MALTDTAIRNAKTDANRTVKLSDGGGLQLWIQPSGAKLWNLAYRFAGKQRKLAIGPYPTIGLKDARERREAAKRLLVDGRDPSHQKRLDKLTTQGQQANTFEAISRELLDKKKQEGKAAATLAKVSWLIDIANATLGPRPIAEIGAPEILATLRQVEARGKHETAQRMRAVIGEVFRYAVATGRAEGDPTGALRGALIAPKVAHRAAIVDPAEFGVLLRAIDGHLGTPEVRIALQLLALTFVRPGELRPCGMERIRFRKGDLGHPRPAHENAPSPPRPAGEANDPAPTGPQRIHRPRRAAFSRSTFIGQTPVRKHFQLGLAALGLRQGRNDRPRLPRRCVFDVERKRQMERRRHRSAIGACGRQRGAACLCAGGILGRAGADDGLVGGAAWCFAQRHYLRIEACKIRQLRQFHRERAD